MEHVQVGFIGVGNMANAIIQGIVKSNTLSYENISIFDITPEKCRDLAGFGVKVYPSAEDLVEECGIILLSVKPQNFTEVLSSVKAKTTTKKLFVSIAAGISTHYIQEALQCPCPVVRAMPNTPLLLGKGATALCRSAEVTPESFALVQRFFESSGTVTVLEESQMNAVISVNGSSPAYFYLFAKAMVDSAVKQGIPADVALALICQTMEGSAAMLRQPGSTPEELIRMVSSPGGTTLQALDVFYQNGLEQTVEDAMNACTRRAEELGK